MTYDQGTLGIWVTWGGFVVIIVTASLFGMWQQKRRNRPKPPPQPAPEPDKLTTKEKAQIAGILTLAFWIALRPVYKITIVVVALVVGWYLIDGRYVIIRNPGAVGGFDRYDYVTATLQHCTKRGCE